MSGRDDERLDDERSQDDGEAEVGGEDGIEGAPPLETILEAVLFASAEPIQTLRLVRLFHAWPKGAVSEALGALSRRLEAEARGVRLVEAAGGWQLRSAPECAAWVRRFFTDKPPRLSRAMLETVAVVAYRQPVTRGEIEAVRGVNCDAVLNALLVRGLLRVSGRRPTPGRPVEYGTTQEFLDLFSLRDLTELPPLPDPMALAELVESAEEAGLEVGEDGGEDGEAAEAAEPGGSGVAESGGGPDPGGTGPGEREDGPGAGDEG
ncbi:MAG: SMC-Scp complex subunit ScpB [Alphaproteobacteria bacterium]